jgi:hypothetical protein
MSDYTIQGLYYRYGKTDDDKIRKLLEKVKIVRMEHKGVGTVYGYYPLNDESLAKIIEKPRNVSLTFDAYDTKEEALTGLVEYKKIVFLVKSTSRFLLKPNIGEVVDQIHFFDLFPVELHAICVNLDDYETLDDTEGEHFLMTATLLKDKNEEIKKAVKDLHEIQDSLPTDQINRIKEKPH